MLKIPLLIGIVSLLAVAAVGLYTTAFTAYLGNDPTTCNNCHVMDAAYEGWYHASHQEWATCGDCHTPHALIPKYIVKAQSGYHHVSAFTLGHIPDAIRAKESSRKIINDNCIYCHSETVEDIVNSPMQGDRPCFDCHRDVGHGNRGISIAVEQHLEKGK